MMNNRDNKINKNDRVIDERVMDKDDRIAEEHMARDPDYLEVGDKTRIIDDNARREAGSDNTTHVRTTRDTAANNRVGDDGLILENDRIDDNPTHATNSTRMTNDRTMNDRDGINRHEVKNMSDATKDDLNADMITGEPGSHPIGTGVGGVGGAVAGAAIGSMAGPLGTLIGGIVGAVAGGGAGHASAEAINPTQEEAYWRAEHANVSYHQEGRDFDRDLHPAYAVGYANRGHYPADARFEDHEEDLRRSWEEVKGDSRLAWDDARLASRDAWNRVS